LSLLYLNIFVDVAQLLKIVFVLECQFHGPDFVVRGMGKIWGTSDAAPCRFHETTRAANASCKSARRLWKCMSR